MKSLTLCLLLLSFFAFADDPPFRGCEAIGCAGKLERIYVDPEGNVRLLPPVYKESDPSMVNCNLNEDTYFVLQRDHPGFEEIYTLLIFAMDDNEEVFVRIETGTDNCQVRYAVVYE
ncbi:hypothetical protein [Ferrimonas marina]|uniref:Uncharacterized protein n=1 Tax=Ferrimonas marina TaxID=299255 RepID=A0A1M5NFN7_9GAMM|nr:hypothetical protein [Ferrimonas marina]SHG88009.1 hypothetical protein SAMN02745129_1023 [Ferrimonas marina]